MVAGQRIGIAVLISGIYSSKVFIVRNVIKVSPFKYSWVVTL